MKRVYKYKTTPDIKYWSYQLKKIRRKLKNNDYKILRSLRSEINNNIALKKIHQTALKNDLYIPRLTGLIGDCMFESIQHCGLCDNKDDFRKALAMMLFHFGDYKLISSHDISLKEIFSNINEVEYVFCHKTNKLYKYTYYTMCCDLSSKGSWSRLPTEFILIVISIFYKVRIYIYHDNGHINKICDIEIDKILSDDSESNIYLGLIGEHHYVPLCKRNFDELELICPLYHNSYYKFNTWARKKADLIGLYYDDSNDYYSEDYYDSYDSYDSNDCNDSESSYDSDESNYFKNNEQNNNVQNNEQNNEQNNQQNNFVQNNSEQNNFEQNNSEQNNEQNNQQNNNDNLVFYH